MIPHPDVCRCGHTPAVVIECRQGAWFTRRRRECPACQHRWTTYETRLDIHRIHLRPAENSTTTPPLA